MSRAGFMLRLRRSRDLDAAPTPSIGGFEPVWESDRAALHASPRHDRIVMSGNQGAIIGTLFDRTAGAPRHHLDRADEARTVATGAGDLVERYWGDFVAILAGAGSTLVFRAPCGAIPVYFKEDADGFWVSSDPGLCLTREEDPPRIDWLAVAGHLYHPEKRVRRTCLAGWQELIGGERLQLSDAGARIDTLWSPWCFTAADRIIADAGEAAEIVGRAVRNSVGAWCRRFERPLVSISGGLDSSVLVAAMPMPPVACVTISTAEPGGDERRYARLVAEGAGARLLERFLDRRQIQLRLSNAAGLTRPVSRLFAQELDRAWHETTAEVGADALFHGGGGDNVFCYLTSPAPVLDSVRLRGVGGDTWRTASDVAALNEVSLGRVVSASLSKAAIDRGRYRWPVDASMLSPDAIRQGARLPDHPWFRHRPPGVLPGKQAHVAALVRIQNYIEAIEPSRRVPVIAPLLSQPVVEACLRVPSWLWCSGGINRAVARNAFAADLPAEILHRRDKGTPGSFGAVLVGTHRREMLEFLLNGHLAKRGMLDVPAITAVLDAEGPLRGNAFLRISELIDVEAWLQSWGATAGTAAVAG